MSSLSGQYQNTANYGGRIANQGTIKQFYNSQCNSNGLIFKTLPGNITVQTTVNQTVPFYVASNLYVAGDITLASDKNLKDNISSITEEKTNNVLNLNPVQYSFKADTKKKIHYGFIAQELEEIYPELVKDSEMGHRKVNYIEIIPLIVLKMKDMQNEIDELKKELALKIANV